ncbi:MAG: VWA domain-containing protein, partial [Deltaproteobacteria bacterium]|nr:VWA domain-containing protein [Deltaproteobacteria bacterium]
MKRLFIFLLFMSVLATQACQCEYSPSWTGTAPPAIASVATPISAAPMPAPHVIRRPAAEILAPGEGVRLEPLVAHPVLLAGEKQTTYLRINLTAFEMDADDLPPANVAIVLDRSGSMAGEGFLQAKKAAVMAVNKLRADDLVSIVAYDSYAEVLVPATRARHSARIIDAIESCELGGSTALYAGVRLGENEVKKNLDKERVNRIVLLSDGHANSGPSSPDELAALGEALRSYGIGVTTIGLGLDYDSKLMARLALESGGNHFFAQNVGDLQKGFDLEFGIGLAAVVKDLSIQVEFHGGARPLKVLNAGMQIHGSTVTARIPQLYSGKQAGLLIEVELPAGTAGTRADLASVSLSYSNLKTHRIEKRAGRVAVSWSNSTADVEANVATDVMVRVATLLDDRRTDEAYRLRKQGKIEEARLAFEESAKILET